MSKRVKNFQVYHVERRWNSWIKNWNRLGKYSGMYLTVYITQLHPSFPGATALKVTRPAGRLYTYERIWYLVVSFKIFIFECFFFFLKKLYEISTLIKIDMRRHTQMVTLFGKFFSSRREKKVHNHAENFSIISHKMTIDWNSLQGIFFENTLFNILLVGVYKKSIDAHCVFFSIGLIITPSASGPTTKSKKSFHTHIHRP